MCWKFPDRHSAGLAWWIEQGAHTAANTLWGQCKVEASHCHFLFQARICQLPSPFIQ
jgi:hypothetical protein